MKLYPKLFLALTLSFLIAFAIAYFLGGGEPVSIGSQAIGLLSFGIIFTVLVIGLIVNPVVALSSKAKRIGEGNLDIEIEDQGKDEVGILAGQLKATALELRKEIREEKQLSDQLSAQKSELEEQKNKLEVVNQQITSSIYYAQRIQNSMLPTPGELRRNVSDSFIFFQPKDVVSGDFYWFEKVRRGRNEYLIIACADCTGHGVPGAIMSMMGGNQLTNIIYYQNYIEPLKILARLDKAIKFELYRDEQSTPKQDGMEIMVCVIDLDSLVMNFAGAGMPLLYWDQEEINIIKSPKLMVGGVEGEDEKEVEDQFEESQLQLKEGDRIYLSSDGFQDQFGGEDDKRFMAKRFRDLLHTTSDIKMKEQGNQVKGAFEKWKGNQDQTDDVLVIGFEV